jgi:hypothetical protein
MKIAALAFLVLLVGFHILEGGKSTLDRPLSMFRDDGLEGVGYLHFGLLLVLGGLAIIPTVQLEHHGGTVVYALGWVLLLVVAVTPSLGELHNTCAFLLLALLYVYYAALLFPAGVLWVYLHLVVPVLLVVATQYHSYGLWQKSLIAYFVIALVVHRDVLTRIVRQPSRPTRPRGGRSMEFGKKRRVYTVEPGRAWKRHQPTLEPSSV